MKINQLSANAALALMMAGSASAAAFGPASGAIGVLGSPIVSLGALSGTAMLGPPVVIFGTTGDLTAASGGGTSMGTVMFSDIIGTVVPETIASFMTFSDTTGGSFFFDATSVQTLAYSSTPASTSITLYLLGDAGDSNLGLSGALTSETLTLNSTGGSAYSASASISAPPAGGVPEPASWSLMLVGFGAAGGWVRRSRKMASVV